MVNPQFQKSWRIILVGDERVGKTSLAYQFGHNAFRRDVTNPPLETSYHRDVVVEGNAVPTTLVDWSPPSNFEEVVDILEEGQAFILTYSITRRVTFEDIINHYKMIREAKREPMTICALVGNKCDLENRRDISTEEGAALARQLGCDFFETSAKTGENVEILVRTLVQRLISGSHEGEEMGTSHGKTRSFLRFLYPT